MHQLSWGLAFMPWFDRPIPYDPPSPPELQVFGAPITCADAALRRPCAGRRHDWQLPCSAHQPLSSAVSFIPFGFAFGKVPYL